MQATTDGEAVSHRGNLALRLEPGPSRSGPTRSIQLVQPPAVDEALVAGVLQGDRKAAATLMRRHRTQMLAAARKIMKNNADAQDAVQDALILALARLHQFEGRGTLSGWLKKIVVNVALGRLRQRTRRDIVSFDAEQRHHNGPWPHQLAPPTDNPEGRLQAAQARAAVVRAVQRLSALHREIIVLRDLEERSVAEVADQLGLSAVAVRVRLHRARAALRKVLLRAQAAQDATRVEGAGQTDNERREGAGGGGRAQSRRR